MYFKDEDELLANEPTSRPFTAIGIRPKSGRFTPLSAGATRPRTALNIFKSTQSSFIPQNKSTSELTSGAVIQGHRGLLARGRRNRPKSASSVPSGSQKTPENIKSNVEQQLNSWKSEQERTLTEVNIMTIDHEKYDNVPQQIPGKGLSV